MVLAVAITSNLGNRCSATLDAEWSGHATEATIVRLDGAVH